MSGYLQHVGYLPNCRGAATVENVYHRITSSSTRVAGACLTCVVPRVTPRRCFGAGGEDQHKRGERKVTPFEPSLVAIWLEWCHFARSSRTRLAALPAAPSLPLRDPGLIHCERVRPRPERASALPGASRSVARSGR